MQKKPQSFKIQARQGDVFVVRVNPSKSKERLKAIEKDKNRTVLAYGEVTGHAHAIAEDTAALWETAVGMTNRLLEVTKEVVLRHEEHDPITIKPGLFEIVRQREYAPEAVKIVAD